MFRKEELRTSVREPFVGLVVHIEYPCSCEICEAGTKRLEEMGRAPRSTERLHIAMKPVNMYDKVQHTWYNKSYLLWSGMGAFTIALNDFVGFVPEGKTEEEQFKEVKKFMYKNFFEWHSVKAVDFVRDYIEKQLKEAETEEERKRLANMLRQVDNLPPGLVEAREIWIPVRKVKPQELEFYGITDVEAYIEQAIAEYKEKPEVPEPESVDVLEL